VAGFEPSNLGSNGKHDNHYTTEGDIQQVLRKQGELLYGKKG
jgi:hypothetical protein